MVCLNSKWWKYQIKPAANKQFPSIHLSIHPGGYILSSRSFCFISFFQNTQREKLLFWATLDSSLNNSVRAMSTKGDVACDSVQPRCCCNLGPSQNGSALLFCSLVLLLAHFAHAPCIFRSGLVWSLSTDNNNNNIKLDHNPGSVETFVEFVQRGTILSNLTLTEAMDVTCSMGRGVVGRRAFP